MIESKETRNDFFDFIKEFLAYNALKDFRTKHKQKIYMNFLQKIIDILREKKYNRSIDNYL